MYATADPANIITNREDNVIVRSGFACSTTLRLGDPEIWKLSQLRVAILQDRDSFGKQPRIILYSERNKERMRVYLIRPF